MANCAAIFATAKSESYGPDMLKSIGVRVAVARNFAKPEPPQYGGLNAQKAVPQGGA